MTEFVGRTGSRRVYSYPETPRAAAAALVAFARNFATGPKEGTTIGADPGTLVPWNAIDVASNTPFTIPAGGTLVSIAGDVTALFFLGEVLALTPTTPSTTSPPTVIRTIISAPAFAAGFTTFSIDSNLDGVTTGGTLFNSEQVPITPKSTGVVLVSGVVTISNGTGVDSFTDIQITIDAAPAATISQTSIPAGATVSVPIQAEFIGLAVGVTRNIAVLASGEGMFFLGEGSSLNVQEVPASTG